MARRGEARRGEWGEAWQAWSGLVWHRWARRGMAGQAGRGKVRRGDEDIYALRCDTILEAQ